VARWHAAAIDGCDFPRFRDASPASPLLGGLPVLITQSVHDADADAPLASVEFALATTTEDLEGAFQLVHDQYAARGYIAPDPSRRRRTPHQALPSTRVFVARTGGEVIATVSLVPDSALGMPCEAIYGEEVAAMRAAGSRLAEVSALAVDRRWRVHGLKILLSLVQMLAIYGHRVAGVDRLCVTVHPRHARFYETWLRFERFGALKTYAAVNGAPAVALTLDLAGELASPADATHRALVGPLFGATETARVLAVIVRDLPRSTALAAEQARSGATAPLRAHVEHATSLVSLN
jgi:hypothetical protein